MKNKIEHEFEGEHEAFMQLHAWLDWEYSRSLQFSDHCKCCDINKDKLAELDGMLGKFGGALT